MLVVRLASVISSCREAVRVMGGAVLGPLEGWVAVIPGLVFTLRGRALVRKSAQVVERRWSWCWCSNDSGCLRTGDDRRDN